MWERRSILFCPGVNQLPESVGAVPHQQILRHRLEVSWPRFVCQIRQIQGEDFAQKVQCNGPTTNLTHARWWHGDFKGLVLCTSLLEWQVLRRASKIPWHRYGQSHAFKCIAWSCPSCQSASASLSGGWAHIDRHEPTMSTPSTDLAEVSFSQAGISDDDLKCGPKLEKCTVRIFWGKESPMQMECIDI